MIMGAPWGHEVSIKIHNWVSRYHESPCASSLMRGK